MVADNDPKKWDYKEHTRVKHVLLDKYLGGWLPILGSFHPKLLIVDGFAGRGEYTDGSEGSPVIILNKAEELISAGRVSDVVCWFVEQNADNFSTLKSIIDRTAPAYPSVKVGISDQPFENVVKDAIENTNGNIVPSFWFIDPFGFTGMSFDTVTQIMALPRSEVFITLMLRDIGRFLSHPDLDDTFDRLFGTDSWRDIVSSKMSGEAKEQALRDLYVDQLRAIGGKVTLFRVCMDEKLQTLYFMIHATKHPRGRWLMKDVMHQQGANGVFAYLGPQDKIAKAQISLLPADGISELKPQLLSNLQGVCSPSTNSYRSAATTTNCVCRIIERLSRSYVGKRRYRLNR